MLSLLHDFRKKNTSAWWRALLLIWIVSIVNIIISSSFTISQRDQSGFTAMHSTHSADVSMLEAFIHFICHGVNPNADLTDVDDSIDKMEFISTHGDHFKASNSTDRKLPFLPHGTLLNTFLEKSTPPPKVG